MYVACIYLVFVLNMSGKFVLSPISILRYHCFKITFQTSTLININRLYHLDDISFRNQYGGVKIPWTLNGQKVFREIDSQFLFTKGGIKI